MPQSQLKEEIDSYFQGENATPKVIAKALRKCFPLVRHSRAGQKRAGHRTRVWVNISKKTKTGDGQPSQIANINTVEQLLKSKGYLILSKTDHVITSLLPINYEMNGTRICIEVCVDFLDLDHPVCVIFLGRQVPLDKVFQKQDINICNVAEITTFLEEIKNIRPCCGYEPLTNEESEYTWENTSDTNEIVTHRKRARSCKLFISPSAVGITCQSCRYTQYLHSVKALHEGGQNNTTQKPPKNTDTDISVCEEDNEDIAEIIKYIMANNTELTEDQKTFISSQLTASTNNPRQHKWLQR